MKFLLTILLVLLLSLSITETVSAQETRLNLYCEECRDLDVYPEDARNFAVNQLFGSESWLTMEQANRFDITDTFGNTVTADLNLRIILYEFPEIRLRFPIPDTMILQVRIIYENGNIVTYAFDINDLNPNGTLPVPTSTTGAVEPPDSTGNGDEEDDYSEDEEDNWSDDDWGDDDWGDYENEGDGDCGGCEVYFDGDEDGDLDEDPYEWTEEEIEL